jgi:hypothetical protein
MNARAALARGAALLLAAALGLPVALVPAAAAQGTVVDAATGQPIPGASLVVDGLEHHADSAGRFGVESGGPAVVVAARAPGYSRGHGVLSDTAPTTIALTQLRPKALYLSVYGIGSSELRGGALQLIERTELNALVIDIKGDRGLVPYRSEAVAAAGLRQPIVTVADMPARLRDLRARGLYLIARIVVFKDDRLAAAHPQWAVHDAQGAVWKDREGLAWIDPFRAEARAYTLALAAEAAALGFDEIQFDYLRFPDATGLVFAQPNDEAARVAAIDGFLAAARARLAQYNVFLAADIFGYVTWNRDDTHIGQQLEAMLKHVDYLSPMLYPSGFTFGIPGHRQPVAAPYDIVQESLQQALRRSGVSPLRFRPWLQAFRDYAFDRRVFGASEIAAQIDAAEAAGSDGWMLWNAANRYSAAGLKAKVRGRSPDTTAAD